MIRMNQECRLCRFLFDNRRFAHLVLHMRAERIEAGFLYRNSYRTGMSAELFEFLKSAEEGIHVKPGGTAAASL